MMKMKIQWTPWLVSMDRRLEVFSAFLFIWIVLFAELTTAIVFGWILMFGGLILRALCISYLIFILTDLDAEENHTRVGAKFLRGSWVWRYYVNYFPIKLVKTAELNPQKHYIFAAFPHGVISVGMFGNFVSDWSSFRDFFPGIRPKLCTLNYHFFVPVFREVALGWGLMSAKRRSILNALTQPHDKDARCNRDGNTANAVGIVVGGAQEALLSRPGSYRLILRKRKGFCRIALETGASLVPVFSFNESDVYDQPSNEPGTRLRRFQDWVKKWTGVAPACFIGRGFFQYSYGIIPRRVPVTTVVGAPIDVTKKEKPTQKDVDELHERYTRELEKLFDCHKHKYLYNHEKVQLSIE